MTMKNCIFDFPVKICFAAGAAESIGEIASNYGKHVFLLHDPFLTGSRRMERVLAGFRERGLSVTCFDDVTPNPRDTVIDRAASVCRDAECDVIVGMGGGSAIDSAKAVSLIVRNGGTAWEYTEREGEPVHEVQEEALPLIAVPTTSGTGTEATPFAVISNQALHMKASIAMPACYAKVALIDPELMKSLPPRVTANTGIDVLAHALEAYLSTDGSPLTDTLCLEAIRLFAKHIRTCISNGTDTEARAGMALASLYAGIGIGHAGTTMPHAIAQALGGYRDVPHGESIAACIIQVIRWTLPAAQKKIAKAAEMIDPLCADLPENLRAEKLPEILENLFRDILGGRLCAMRDYGVTEEDAEPLTDLVMNCYYGDCRIHPKVPARADLLEVIRKCI